MSTHWAEQLHQSTTVSSRGRRLARTSVVTAALMTVLAIGIAANANADNDDDFWECVSKHPGPTDATVCCIFYDQPCGVPIDVPVVEGDTGSRRPGLVGSVPELTTADPGQTGPTNKSGLTPTSLLPVGTVR
jgi:hypothetical protein